MDDKLNDVEARSGSVMAGDGASTITGAVYDGQTLTPAVNRRLVLRIDSVVLSIMTVTATLAALDKNALGYAAIFGIKSDAGMVGQQYSWLGSIVYFGFLIMQFPNIWLLTKVPPGKYLAGLIISWGVLLLCMVAANNFAGLATVRFFLGIFEAGQLPTCMILTSVWYRREEHALRTAIWYNTFAGIFGGILSYAISGIHGSLSTWKNMFLLYGCVTLGFGILVFFALPDSPATAWFYTAEDKAVAVLRTAGNQTGSKTINVWRIGQLLEALRDPKYWVIVIYVLAWGVVNSGITNFNPLIISGYGFTPTKTTLMATPQAAVAFVSQVLCALVAFYVPNIRCLIWILSNFPALVGTIMIHLLDIDKYRTASLAGVYLLGFYNTSWVMVMSLVASNNGGTTKRSFASVTVALVYSVGNIIGPQFFREEQAPHYRLGIFAMMIAFTIEILCGMMYWSLCYIENRRRDNNAGQIDAMTAQAAGLHATEEDLTDGKNPHFRYAM